MPLTPETLLRPGKFTVYNVGAYLGPGEDEAECSRQKHQAIVFFQHYGVLPTRDSNVTCCNTRLRTKGDASRGILGFRWLCSVCKSRITPLRNTFFSHAKLDPAIALQMVVSWFYRIPVTESHTQGASHTQVDWFEMCRKVACIVESHDRVPIGGPNDIVEMDESHLFKRKGLYFLTARRLKFEEIWIFGGISRLTKKRFAVRVDCKDKNTLVMHILERVSPGTYVVTDGWRAYNNCDILCQLKGHSVVNHKLHFVDPNRAHAPGLDPSLGDLLEDGEIEFKVHTNSVERMWRDMKDHLRNIRGDDAQIDEYVSEYLYRSNILDFEGEDRGRQFLRFLNDVRRVYPGVGVNPVSSDKNTCLCPECRPDLVH